VKQEGKKNKGTGIITVDDLPDLKFDTYLKFCFFVFMFVGIFMLVYCFLVGVNPFMTDIISCPFQWLGMGFICLISFIVFKLTNNRFSNG